MDPNRFDQIASIFHRALEFPSERREAFLESACGADAELRAEVVSLLAAEGDDSFLERPALPDREPVAAGAAAPRRRREQPGPDDRWIGRVLAGKYRLETLIGKGGMGAVYGAGRVDDIKQQVAVKLVDSGLLSPSPLRRFTAERQILARLDHPNIARLLDGGTTEEGVPFVVMERIEGERLDRFCDGKRLSVRERLELFRQLCSAVQYAHRNLVIHRDLKPGNVLVTGEGAVKLLDFGIAKLLESGAEDATLDATRAGDRLLTPAYASPEQLRGEPVSTASDVYSLGVILYELLAGRRPYDATSSSLEEIARSLSTSEPERPSTAASTTRAVSGDHGAHEKPLDAEEIGRRRNTTPAALRRELAGDLDQIVLTAMRAEPERRYASVEALSEDVRRHLAGLPVLARKDSLVYRSGKFIRRHRLALSASAVIVVLLAGAVASLVWAFDRARSQQTRAERLLFASHVRLASQAWNLSDTDEARRLLEAVAPSPGGEDLRKFEWYYLWNLLGRDRRALQLGTPTGAAALSPDGLLLATASREYDRRAECKVLLWDTTAGSLRATYLCGSLVVQDLEFSPDGKLLVAAGSRPTSEDQHVSAAQIWDVGAGRRLQEFEGERGYLHVRVVEVTSRKTIALGDGDKSGFHSTAFSPDNSVLAVAGGCGVGDSRATEVLADGELSGFYSPIHTRSEFKISANDSVTIWDTRAGRRLASMRGGLELIRTVAISPDGTTLAAAGSRRVATNQYVGGIELWDLRTWHRTAAFDAHSATVTAVAFSATGSSLASAGEDGLVRIWDAGRTRDPVDLVGHQSPVRALAFSRNGELLASASEDRTVKLWNVSALKEEATFRDSSFPCHSVAFTPDGAFLATAASRQAYFWRLASVESEVFADYKVGAEPAMISPSGKWLATGLEDGTVRIHSLGRRQDQLTLKGHTDAAWTLAFLPDESRIVTGGGDTDVLLSSTTTGETLRVFDSESGNVAAVDVSRDGRLMATCGDVLKIWRLATGQETAVYRPESGMGMESVAFSPTEDLLAVACLDGSIRLLDADSATEVATLAGHTNRVWIIRFSRDGKLLTSASHDGTARIWDVASRREVISFKGHQGGVRWAELWPDGSRLATTGDDGTIRIWEVATGTELAVLRGHRGTVWSVAISADGNALYSAGADGTMRVWRGAPPGPLE